MKAKKAQAEESQQGEPREHGVPLAWVAALAIAAALGVFYWYSQKGLFFISNLLLLLTEGGLAAVIFLAAGGLGWPVVRLLEGWRPTAEQVRALLVGQAGGGAGAGGDAGADAPAGRATAPLALRIATACGIGLWFWSIAVMAVGSLSYDLLKAILWWPPVIGGAALAGWYLHKPIQQVRLPSRVSARELVWVLAAVAAGLWLAGAIRPPGVLQTSDNYDVLEYHLQLPREFLADQALHATPHNVYGYYPLGVEMLFLLGMILRGGAYEGMYAAVMLHGLFGLGAVCAAASLGGGRLRGRLAAVLLACLPLTINMSWLAMVELAQVFYTLLALLWLRQWLAATADPPSGAGGRGLGEAIAVGLMVGGACGVKYLSVGLTAGPVLVVMLLAGLLVRRRAAWHVLPAGAACLLLFAPWLVRNMVYTGNPVFPLASSLLGRGHWDEQSQARWQAGHGPTFEPPVPPPPNHQPHANLPSHATLFYRNFAAADLLGAPGYLQGLRLSPLVLLAVMGALAAAAMRGRADPAGPARDGAWDLALAAVLAIQLAVWAAMTHGMPTRFLAPAAAPLTLLAAGFLARIRGSEAAPTLWSAGLCWALLLLTALSGLTTSALLFARLDPMGPPDSPLSPRYGMAPDGQTLARELPPFAYANALPKGSRLLLIGEARGFYFPPNTVYATAFDKHPLERLIDHGIPPDEILRELRGRGITHIYVAWPEVLRLAHTYGYPAPLSADAVRRSQASQPPGLGILDRLGEHGLKLHSHILQTPQRDMPTTAATTLPAGQWPMATIYAIE